MEIKKSNPIYAELIENCDENCSCYTINTDKINVGDTIECPKDPDMKVKKLEDGFEVTKLSYSKTVFKKT